jgi:hypothetical protein
VPKARKGESILGDGPERGACSGLIELICNPYLEIL